MINPKIELEKPKMKTVQEIIDNAIEEKHEIKIIDDAETNLKKFVINHEEFWDYAILVSDLLSYSQAVLSNYVGNFYNNFEKCDFAKEDFFKYLTLVGKIWKVLDENVSDKEFSRTIKFRCLEDYFDDYMTGIRRKIYKLNFDKTEVWKELEKRIDKEILKPKFQEKIQEETRDESSSLLEHETKVVENSSPSIGLKRDLASLVGITLCGKCGTRTKLQYKETIEGKMGDEWIGYTICPKCGHKEKWLSGDRG